MKYSNYLYLFYFYIYQGCCNKICFCYCFFEKIAQRGKTYTQKQNKIQKKKEGISRWALFFLGKFLRVPDILTVVNICDDKHLKLSAWSVTETEKALYWTIRKISYNINKNKSSNNNNKKCLFSNHQVKLN